MLNQTGNFACPGQGNGSRFLFIRRGQETQKITTETDRLKARIEQRDRFFSILAHDLKAPLAGFLSFLRMMVEDIDSFTREELQVALKDMQECAENQYMLLENILQWSLMQRGELSFMPERILLSDLLKNNASLASGPARQKGIKVESRVVHEIEIVADKNMLQAVFRNLVFNALKFTPEDGLIQMSCRQHNGVAEVVVRDNGIGMDQKTLSGLFRPEKKTRRNGTNGEKGTGLGMVLSREFVSMHKGRIWAESSPGQGSVFYVQLPVIFHETAG